MKDFSALGCGRTPSDKDCYLTDLSLAWDEEITLTLARFFFSSFAQPNSMGWISALAEAEARFGHTHGPQIAARLLAALQSIRRARKSVFMFNSPCCPGCASVATEHERRLVTAIHAIRSGDIGKAHLEILMLCEGSQVETVLIALSALARALDSTRPQKPKSIEANGEYP